MVTVSLENLYASSICSIFPICIESNGLKKSTIYSVAPIFFAGTPLMTRRIVKICEVVDRFL